MKRMASFIVMTSLLAPQSAFALSRADAYKFIWQPLNRPIEDTRETPFTDVPVSHPYFELITYGKARGVINDTQSFFPNDDITLNDALIWLLRSRNTDAPRYITHETLNSYTNRYNLLDNPQDTVDNRALSEEEIQTMITKLDDHLKNEMHIVSYYSDDFAGSNTAFGEIFDPNALTAAHRTFPHNTLVRVTNTNNGKEVIVRINDRGPYIDGRNMDLSREAFSRIAPTSSGVIDNVTFERLGSADVVDACPRTQYQRRLGSALLTPGIPRIIAKGATINLSADASFRMIQMRRPSSRPERSAKWITREETLTINFDREGIYTFILHEDSGKRRRFRTKVIAQCTT